ncbi:diguanylate cyclase [Parafrankia sp. EAN1pec]|uniref:GGDEF domain-containing protein n=1 Tax=Parafrankia sp. (strain EAN1pec) TaxID=298653 RepID=UPI00005445D7|nr:diguanylate cyclase [Frankia sp. EAN1pec]
MHRLRRTQQRPAGDRCLERVAACLARNTGAGHLAARYGGEEFAIVMPGAEAEEAGRRAEELRRAVANLAEPHPAIRGVTITITISVGFAALTPTADDHQRRLVGLADEALYRASGTDATRWRRRGPRTTMPAPPATN